MNTDQQKIELIRQTIKAEGDSWRQRYPVLARQNLMGFSIFAVAVSGVGLSAYAYLVDFIAWYVCIPLVAFFTSLLHELEHDLIHWQYFRDQRSVHHLMLLVGWILRPGTINPWIRRHLHFLHHKVSGSDRDIEERGIGNGKSYGPLRFFIMLDTFGGNLLNAVLHAPRGRKLHSVLRIIAANFPFAVACAIVWYGYWVLILLQWQGFATQSDALVATLEPWIVTLIAPFYLRSFCLNFISSSMHYYGDVDSLLKQTQVLNRWYLWPMQLFCCNFGSTHGIHHFVVGEPFYIRQLTARAAHRVMREQGVRFNDLGTFGRANRYTHSQSAMTERVA